MRLQPRVIHPTLAGAGLCVVAAVFCSVAHGQPSVGTIFQQWRVSEVFAGTTVPVSSPNGILEPGESLMFTLSISFDPPVGTIVQSPLVPPPGFGPIAGFGSLSPVLMGSGGAEGTWSNVFRPPEWILGGSGSGPSGSYYLLRVGQLGLPGTIVNLSNPNPGIWRAVWTPGSYHERIVTWESQWMHDGALFVQYGTDPGTGMPLYSG